MPSWSARSKHVKRFILAVPGFNQGRGKRGAWFAWTPKIEDFFRGFKKRFYTVKYEIYEPESRYPLSDGELEHLTQEISSTEQAYSSLLYFNEFLIPYGRGLRKRGIRGLFLYLLMVLTVKQFWIIILLWPQTLLANFLNLLRLRIVGRSKRVIGAFWQRGQNPEIIRALNEAKKIYQSLDKDPLRSEPLRKYQYLREYFKKKREKEGDPEKEKIFALIEQAYRDIIAQLTGESFLLKVVPKNIRQRIVDFFNVGMVYPYPDNIFAVRNLYQDLTVPTSVSSPKIIARTQRVEGNSLEMFLLRTQKGEGIVIPCPGESIFRLVFQADTLENIQRRNLPLEAVLHIGTDKEKQALLGFNPLKTPQEFNEEKVKQTQMRIQNALLDTFRQQDALMTYYFREVMAAYGKRAWTHPLYMWGNLVHIGFPWLFLSHGIPAFAVVACTWLFWDPIWRSQDAVRWGSYFNNLLEGVEKAYHNVNLKIVVHSGLGDVNKRIMEGTSYRDVLEKIESSHFPRKFRDMVLMANIAKETNQLNEFQREPNDFVGIPAFCFNETQNRIEPIGEILPK